MHNHTIMTDKKKRLLCFTSSLDGGGAEKHLLRFITALDKTVFEPSLALTRTGGAFEHLLPETVPLYPLSTGKYKSSTIRMVRAIKPLRQLIKETRPDILYSVMDYANVVALAAVQGLDYSPVMVLSVQNTPSQAYGRSGNHLGHFFLKVMRFMYPHADGIIALSQGVASDLLHFTPSISGQLQVIYNAGVDAELLQSLEEPIEEELPLNAPLIVACGSLTEQKGFGYLLEAFASVRQVLPACLWIVGEGSKRVDLEQKIKQLNLLDSVRLLGFKSNPYKYMAAAQVFVLSSLWEGFGNVVVEAMACGTPVIATDCPHGPSEIIINRETGLLAPPADSAILAQTIIRLLNDPELQKRLAENGRIRSRDFDTQVIASQYEQLFLQLLSRKRK